MEEKKRKEKDIELLAMGVDSNVMEDNEDLKVRYSIYIERLKLNYLP